MFTVENLARAYGIALEHCDGDHERARTFVAAAIELAKLKQQTALLAELPEPIQHLHPRIGEYVRS